MHHPWPCNCTKNASLALKHQSSTSPLPGSHLHVVVVLRAAQPRQLVALLHNLAELLCRGGRAGGEAVGWSLSLGSSGSGSSCIACIPAGSHSTGPQSGPCSTAAPARPVPACPPTHPRRAAQCCAAPRSTPPARPPPPPSSSCCAAAPSWPSGTRRPAACSPGPCGCGGWPAPPPAHSAPPGVGQE